MEAKTVFREIPINKRSLAHTRIIYGVGINDADYIVRPIINDKQLSCPYYSRWLDMLVRCYNEREHERHPTYIDCYVCDEWMRFSNFKSWMKTQDWKGKFLDKDILIQGNKEYSSDTCLFVTCAINNLLLDRKAKRGQYPQGVDFSKQLKKYRARVKVNGKEKHLGYFDNDTDAFEAYKTAKYLIIKDIAFQQTEPLKSALLNYKITRG